MYWDRIDGVDGDVSRLSVIDEVEVEGDTYSFDDEEETFASAPMLKYALLASHLI